MSGSLREDPRLRDVVLLAIAVAGLAACLALMFLAMRAVMDIGGYCAEGGPYVIESHCPEGATPALLLATFGLFGFGGLGMVAGARMGGYGWLPLLAWTGLFASLGWNFLDYGLLDPPPGEGIVWGWLIPGVLFELMAWVPFAFVVVGVREARRTSAASRDRPTVVVPGVLRGPGQPARTPEPISAREVHDTLQDIASLMGTVIDEAAAETPADPARRVGEVAAARPSSATDGPATGEFTEGTQALLDRLERLADMRDRGLLGQDEYETAKEAVMHELEART